MSSRNTIMVNRTVYQVAVVTFIASLVWIGIGIYQAFVKPLDQINVDVSVLAPINPTLDTSVVGPLGTRIKFDPSLAVTVVPSAAPSASRSATATTSATINKGKIK